VYGVHQPAFALLVNSDGCCVFLQLLRSFDTLPQVKLTYAAMQRAGSYSGGMKRRLSVAIALLGDPKVCGWECVCVGVWVLVMCL
jgi:ABC-type Na+ transport system ATPase subunit NatA